MATWSHNPQLSEFGTLLKTEADEWSMKKFPELHEFIRQYINQN